MFRRLLTLAALGIALGACQPTRGMETEDVATTIPARTSATAGAADAVQDPGAGVVEHLESRSLLAEPGRLQVEDLGYRGAPAPLSAAAQRHHAVGHAAVTERRWSRAARAFTEVLAAAPDSARDYYSLATAYANAGKDDLAASALAEALVREFPHLWHRYTRDPLLAPLRASGQHADLETLATKLRELHAEARANGSATTVTWPGTGRGAGAQAGVSVGERFVPLAPRVWMTTARTDAELVVDAYWDRTSGRVVNVHATAHPGLDMVTVETYDAATGRRLAHRDVLTGGRRTELDSASRTLRLRFDGGAWQDLRGRAVADQEEPEQAPLRITKAGIGLETPVHRIAWTHHHG